MARRAKDFEEGVRTGEEIVEGIKREKEEREKEEREKRRVRRPEDGMSLKALAKKKLGRVIQDGGNKGHDSVEDAVAARDLVHHHVLWMMRKEMEEEKEEKEKEEQARKEAEKVEKVEKVEKEEKEEEIGYPRVVFGEDGNISHMDMGPLFPGRPGNNYPWIPLPGPEDAGNGPSRGV